MTQYRQDDEELEIRFDTDTGIGTVTYRSTLLPHHTANAYKWFIEHLPEIGLANIRGLVFDFRNVLKFEQGNFQAVRRESRQVNEELDLKHFPVALVVENLYQEEMVRISSKITGQETRVRIVHSDEEVMTFIDEWHQENKRGEHDPVPPGE